MPGLLDLLHNMMGITPPPPNPAPPAPPSDHDLLVAQTRAKYPFVYNSNAIMIPGTKPGGEGWPAGETGDPSYPRPKALPLGQHGVEIGPGSSPEDVAGEVLHVDPYANQTRAQLKASLSPEQKTYLKKESLDYGNPQGPEEEDHAWDNAVDSAIRGKVVGQWPDKANQAMNYSPAQQKLLDNLSQYMRTGRRPQ